MRQKKKIACRKKYLIYYTGCFSVIAAVMFSWFYLNGKTFVWDSDGVTQHLNALVYYRSWLRGILKTLIFEHRLEIPMWDSTIGYGSDVLRTFHYYAIGDPLNLLSVFVPKAEWMDEFYSLLILLRIYLAGLAFSMYCFFHRNGRFETLLGSLLYAFCYWTVFSAVRHPYFMNPMIYFPLVLLGADIMFRRKRPFVYIASLGAAILCNFYFGYMICLLIVVYCIFRYFMIFGKLQWKQLGTWIGRFLISSVLALAIAAVILLPVVSCALGTGRFEAEHYIPLLYPGNFYSGMITGYLAGASENWTQMGYTAYGVLGIFLLFLQRKKYTAYKIGFLVLTAFLMIPYVGYVMNGFSYASNRFSWAYAMLVSYILVKTWPDLRSLKEKKQRQLILCTMIYCGLCFVFEQSRSEMLMCALVTLVLLVMWQLTVAARWAVQNRIFLTRCCTVAGLAVCLILQAFYKYAPEEGNYVGEFNENNRAMEQLTNRAPSVLAKEISDDSFWRYDQYGTNERYNAAVALGLHGVSYYWSLSESDYGQFQRELYLNNQIDYQYTDLDGRSFLDALASVKYFIAPAAAENFVPYGFSEKIATRWVGNEDREAQEAETVGNSTDGMDAVKYSVYKTQNSLPLGYTYDTWIAREDYEQLTAVQKQQALLQGAVVDDSSLPETVPLFDEQEQEYSMQIGNGIEMQEQGLLVRKAGATVAFQFEGIPQCETYLILEGLDFEGICPSDQYTKEEWDGLSLYEKNQVKKQDEKWVYPDTTSLTVAGNSTKELYYANDRYTFYTDLHDFLINTGYSENTLQTITVTFNKPGYYTFDQCSIVCQPVERLGTYVEERKQEVLENLSLEANRISGTIQLDTKKILCLSLLYSDGWTAYVDGEKTELLKVNTMYMGLELDPGTHEIELRYRTPGVAAGLVLTVSGSVLTVVLWCYSGIREKRQKIRKRNRRRKRGQDE